MFDVRQPRATEKELQAERDANAGAQQPTFRPIGEGGTSLRPGDVTDVAIKGEIRQPYIAPKLGDREEPSDKIELFKGKAIIEADAPIEEHVKRRHSILIASLEEEAERQAEERQQAQIDHEYYDHQQWTAEEARVLMERGQAPLVFNEARGAIDWLAGTERRLRKDYKIRPREKGDEELAEVKTKVFKYVDDVNNSPWHRSRVAKQMFISGLGWLEEGINLDPEKELIYSGSEDWRNVYRDSRGREFDQSDWRYIHRRKIIDIDYACMLLPKASSHLMSIAGRWGSQDDEADDVWYLGQNLVSAHSADYSMGADGLFGGDYTVRRAGRSTYDHGRRNSVELIETWYRVPEAVKVFSDGPAYRKVFNPADPRHAQLARDKCPMYETVKWRMRVMIGTKYEPCWDGVSPFSHGQFSLIGMFGYRRGRDGAYYGAMRGMRDPQDDLNKRKSKALHILSNNRITIKEGATDDLEDLRQEAARADGMLVVNDINNIRFEKNLGEAAQNLEMAEHDRVHIRNVGGVTGDNMGQESSAVSGKAIIAKQDQGSLTTFELFDNFFIAFKLAGQRRMANIEQFCNQPWHVRIDPEGGGRHDWVKVNEFDERTGEYKNDITRGQADFIVDQQDYRATLTQAAMDSMFELLGNLANFAPQAVLNLLDLVVDTTDISGKDEWVRRIRQINGQSDPGKAPTPEEQAKMQQAEAMDAEAKQIQLDTARAQLDVLRSKVNDTNAAKVLKNLQGLLAAVETTATVATMPNLAGPADALAKSAGFKDETAADAIVTQPAAPAVAPVDPAMAPELAPGIESADVGNPHAAQLAQPGI